MKNLRFKLTAFNTLVTGSILLCMTVLCLTLSEKSSRAEALRSFDGQFTAAALYVQSQDRLTLRWLRQVEAAGNMRLTILDGDTPLFSTGLAQAQGESAAATARRIARQNYGMPEEDGQYSCIFSMKEAGTGYYAGVAKVPKEDGYLELTCLYPLQNMERAIVRQRVAVGLGATIAIGLLGVFSWKFTGRMLRPIDRSRQEQKEFIAAASHELRTPLTAILSAASAMERAEGAEKKTFAQVIRREGRRMGQLIEDMLDLASAESSGWQVSPRVIEPDMLVLDLFETYELQAREKGLRLVLDLPEDVPELTADPDRISQALSILLDNALSYTPAPGRVTVGLHMAGRKLRFTVADTGPGVREEERERIFQRFYRSEAARSDRKHFGLGLSTAAEITAKHHGKLWVENGAQGGAIFVLELPIN